MRNLILFSGEKGGSGFRRSDHRRSFGGSAFGSLAVPALALALAGCVETPTGVPGDALVPGTPYNATGSIECTNQIGPTLFDCPFGVIRRGGGSGTVVVTLPTGNTREIVFERGVPVGSDAPARLSYSRTEGTTEVFIGETERYRIFDAVIYGG